MFEPFFRIRGYHEWLIVQILLCRPSIVIPSLYTKAGLHPKYQDVLISLIQFQLLKSTIQICSDTIFRYHDLIRLLLQVGGGLKPLKQKWQFQHFFGANWAQKFDFSHKPTRMPIIAFRRLELVKKGVSITFLMLAVTNSGSWN